MGLFGNTQYERTGMAVAETNSSDIRIDKWLWAARFFKTRALAAAAVLGGKVKVNGERVKAAKVVRRGEELCIRIGVYEHVVRVLALSARRGPASEAALLYQESEESKAVRKQLAARLAAERIHSPMQKGRPSKRARRELIRIKQGNDG
jgi:ribosome-associated heat shock protein Hsp15